jgi:hypothetical protein
MARRQIAESQFKADPRQTIPKVVLRAAGLLVVTALALTAAARVSGMTPYASPLASTPIASRTIVMTPVKPGGAVVTDCKTGEIIITLVTKGGGFVGAAERVPARARACATPSANPRSAQRS